MGRASRLVLAYDHLPPPIVYRKPRHDRLRVIAFELGNRVVNGLRSENAGPQYHRWDRIGQRAWAAGYGGMNPDAGLRLLIEITYPLPPERR